MAVAVSPDPEIQDALEQRRQAQCAQKWIAELGISEKAQRKWLERARKITKRYRKDDSDTTSKRRFAMLWSNTQTIQPAVYSRPPQPVVSRRFNDADPVARIASEILERCLSYSIDTQDVDGILRQASYDYVLIARGQIWERYVPTHGPQVVPEIELQVVTSGDEGDEGYQDEDGKAYKPDQALKREDGSVYAEGEPYDPVVFEESLTDYVNWSDFGHSVARTWDEVSYVWRRVYLSRDQLIDRFGEKLGKMVPLDWGPIEQGGRDDAARMQKKAAVYEIWDKAEKKVVWVSKSWSSRPLDERDDPLGLPGFFPCPRPLLGTTANDSTIPVPDYVYYQDQAEEIDKLTARIAELQEAIKVRGFYAGDIKTNLNNLLNSANNMLIPVPDWQTLKDGGGVAGKVEWWPIGLVVQALDACIAQRQQLINDVYQITGVADILRGQGNANATATAEGIKAQWGTLRIRDRQIEMMRFARDNLRIKAAVIASKFSADTLKAMSGVKLPTNAEKEQLQQQIAQQQMQAQLMAQAQAAQQAQQQPQQPPQPGQPPQAPPQMPGHNGGPQMPPEPTPEQQQILQSPSWEDVEALLQNGSLRQFRIDIETDSTIEPNEQEEKQRTVEFLQAMGQMIQQWGPAIEAQPALAPMAGAFIKYGARRFRAGRELEEVIDTTVDKITEAASQPKPAPSTPPKPVDQTAIAVASINQQTEQMVQQEETNRANIEANLHQQEIALQHTDQQLKVVALNRDPKPQAFG